jgi:hypothetical protein
MKINPAMVKSLPDRDLIRILSMGGTTDRPESLLGNHHGKWIAGALRFTAEFLPCRSISTLRATNSERSGRRFN